MGRSYPIGFTRATLLAITLVASGVARAEAPVDGALLEAWVSAVGPRRSEESFGNLVVRLAKVQLGRPYLVTKELDGPEWVHADLATFHCVSLVESSVAMARCLWQGHADASCFLGEIERLRYRDGHLVGFPSRLHYFSDWLENNAVRGNIELLTRALGGRPRRQPFFFMTEHEATYAQMVHPEVRAAVREGEVRLSNEDHVVLEREQLASVTPALQDGDIVAVVGDKPGILVSHTGLIAKGADGVARLLHASSYHHQVLLTSADIAQYVLRRADRRGLMVARPKEPGP
ncbi:MAG: N-acetylmuramoyl-L-alanine amidase-like domain-containing protein [Myxococcota bacterium]